MKRTQTSPEALEGGSTKKEVVSYPNDIWIPPIHEFKFRKYIKKMVKLLNKKK